MSRILVVGGGIAGMQSSLDLAEMGHQVHLVEKEKELGGNLRNLYRIFPTNEKATELLSNFTSKVNSHHNISVLTDSTVDKLEAKARAFKTTVSISGKRSSFDVEAIILATGFAAYDPAQKTEYGYARCKDVVSSIDLESMLRGGSLLRPSNAQKPKAVTFVQCVGFRDVKAYQYCSYFCCTLAIKDALMIKRENPDIEVTVMFMDVRTPFEYENLYSDARSIGVKFIRARPAEVFEKDDRLVLYFEDTLTGEVRSIQSELVVLSVGGIPSPETNELSKMMNVALDKMGFFKVQIRPSKTNVERIFVVGAACGPKDIDYSLSQAGAAASQINKILSGSHDTSR